MVNKTIDAVIASLHSEFGDSYEYLAENNEQGLETPCFLVALIRPTSKGGMWRHYSRVMPIVIHYFPKDDLRPKRECYAIGERILEAVETIEIEGVTVSGKDLEIQMVDNVLQVFVTYDFWTQRVVEEPEIIEEITNDIKIV